MRKKTWKRSMSSNKFIMGVCIILYHCQDSLEATSLLCAKGSNFWIKVAKFLPTKKKKKIVDQHFSPPKGSHDL